MKFRQYLYKYLVTNNIPLALKMNEVDGDIASNLIRCDDKINVNRGPLSEECANDYLNYLESLSSRDTI